VLGVVKQDEFEAWSLGAAEFYPAHENQLIVGVRCRLGTLEAEEIALLDTAAEWSVIGGDTADALAGDLGAHEQEITISTRLGKKTGTLRRLSVTLLADAGKGDSMDIEATVLVIDDWTGPVVLGYRGFMERLKVALDPGADAGAIPTLYFGAY